jgi:Mn2+/Fe2+ NRAMP family transporter
MLIWSAVLNGIVAVPIMAVMMVVVTRLSVMGRFSARPTLTFFGWAGTALMFAIRRGHDHTAAKNLAR